MAENTSAKLLVNREEQRELVKKAKFDHGGPKSGDYWFAYPASFWNSFMETEEDIKTADNTLIFDDVLQGIKNDLAEGDDYVLECSEVNDLIVQWYEVKPELKFEVVTAGDGSQVVDIHPACFAVEPKYAESEGEKSAGKDKEKPLENSTLTLSRYTKFGKLKSLVAKHLKVKPSRISLAMKTASSKEEYQPLADMDAESMNKILSDVLPEIGLVLWNMSVTIEAEDTRRFSAIHKYNPEDPQVGQRVDAILDNVWHEAVIESVTYSSPKSEVKSKDMKENTDDSKDEKKVETMEKEKTKTEDTKDEKVEAEGSPKTTAKPKPKGTMRIHFLSFESSKDKVFPVGSSEVCSAYSMVADWRTQLRVGSKVEIQKSAYTSGKEWVEAQVEKIDRTGTSDLKKKYIKQLAERKSEDLEKNTSMLKKLRKNLLSNWTSTRRVSKDRTKSSAEGGNISVLENTSVASVESDMIPISHHGLVCVKVATGASYYSYTRSKEVIIDLGSEEIAAEGTHVQKKKTGYSAFGGMGYRDTKNAPSVHGVVGLKNIGNTCYMNSTLQCLMATEPLQEYFLSGAYKNDINRRNPLGFGGKVAIAYGKLMESYFGDDYSVIAPSDFKSAMGNAYAMFQGYQQQDSHELLNLLVDALHEDLNRVKNKPLVETPDANGRSDEVMSKIEWDNFLMRNQSAIVDTLYGQLKSHLVCPDCKQEATKFDTFSNWAVPIPFNDMKLVKITMVTINPRLVKVEETEDGEKHKVVSKVTPDDKDVFETRTIKFVAQAKGNVVFGRTLAQQISIALNISTEDIAIYVLKHNRPEQLVYDIFGKPNSYMQLSEYSDTEFVAYELDPLEKPDTLSQPSKKGVQEAEVASSDDEKEKEKKSLPKASVVEGEEKDLEKKEGKDNEKKEGQNEEIDEAEEEEDVEEPATYMKISYRRKNQTSQFRGYRLSEVIRFYESKTSIAKLHEMIWKRTKLTFDLKEKLKEPGFGASDHDVTEEELELSKSLYKVEYEKKSLDPDSTETLVYGKSYNRETLFVEIIEEGMKNLAPGVKIEPPSNYSARNDMKILNASLNVGFVGLDASCQQKDPKEERVDLYKCFEAFRLQEKLEESEAWYCNKCKKHVQADKKMDVYKTGEILIVVLKRFRGERWRREKLNCPVDFPITGLNLEEFVESKEQRQKIFDLYGVSYHSGSMMGGHYTAKIKVGGEWYDMNDSSVRPTSEDSIVDPRAYVLFYRQRKEETEKPTSPAVEVHSAKEAEKQVSI